MVEALELAGIVFLSTFVSVFALGLQSLNVNQGHYLAAGLTSVVISTGHVYLYRYTPNPAGLQLVGYYAGGIAGITSSMWFHRIFRSTWWPKISAWLEAIAYTARARWALFRHRREIARAYAHQVPCGRCGDGTPFQCHRADCPRLGCDVH